MAVKFNPFTGQLQIDEKGSGGGGGAQYIDGEVATYNDLSLDAGVAALNTAWLVREASGTWLIGRKPAGIYIRTATGGSSRDADYTYAGIFPDVFSDANFTLFDDADTTKNVKFNVGANVPTGTTVTLTSPASSGTLALTTTAPASHAASHNYGGSDAVTRVEQARTLMDTNPDDPDNAALYYTSENGAPQKWIVDAPSDFRSALELGTAATADIGTGAGEVAEGNDSRITGAIQSTLVDAKGDLIVGTAADTVARLPVGATNGHVLTVDSAEASGMKWAAASGGIAGSTSTDNAIVRADSTANTVQSSDINIEDATTSTANNVTISNQHSGQTNSSLVLSPKGTGSLSASKPNGAASGGNARGANATDWQTLRTTAAQVASGTGSVIIGGDRNTSSNVCTIAGGENCTASSQYGIAFGRTNAATTGAANAVVGGQDSTVSGRESFIAAGNRNTASAGCCAILSGDDTTLDRPYMVGHSGGRFAAGGDSQSINVNLRAKTTTNSAVELKVGGYAVTSQTITIPAGKVISGIINIHGVKSDGSAVAHYIRQFSYKRVGATSTLVGTATIGTDIAAGTSITFNDPDTNGDAISISVVGVVSEIWRWTAHISAVETAYGT